MTADTSWEPFGIPADEYDEEPARNGVRVLNLALRDKSATKDRAASWLRNAMIALGVLAVAAAVVSYAAQFAMVNSARHVAAVAALEAGIPDVAALIFAALGIALALHGKRAVRARLLNVGAVATSVFMNYAAAGAGWRDFAIWIMPPVAYALASDTAIGVVRAYTLARQRALSEALADDETTPLAVLGGLALWLLRLSLAPASTLRGFRRWVVEEIPVAPGRGAAAPVADTLGKSGVDVAIERVLGKPGAGAAARGPARGGSKTARFLALVAERHGPLAALPLADVSRISTELAPEVQLHTGTARSALRARVLQARGGASA
jgi:hypothetical protein